MRISAQKWLPMIEFEDGSAYRAESLVMAETTNAGKLFEQAAGSGAPAED